MKIVEWQLKKTEFQKLIQIHSNFFYFHIKVLKILVLF